MIIDLSEKLIDSKGKAIKAGESDLHYWEVCAMAINNPEEASLDQIVKKGKLAQKIYECDGKDLDLTSDEIVLLKNSISKLSKNLSATVLYMVLEKLEPESAK